MNKLFLVLLFTLITGYICAQTAPKIRVYQSLFSTKYEIGDKTSTKKDVAALMKNKDVNAYSKWQAADRSDRTAMVGAIVGVGGFVMGIAADDPGVSLVGYTISIGGFATQLISSLTANKRREKSIDMYNAKYNY